MEAPFYKEQAAELLAHLKAARDVTGLENLRTSGTIPAAFFEGFNAALACHDRLIEFALTGDGSRDRIFCRKGCSNCCIDLVRGISGGEILNIYRFVRPWRDVEQVFEHHRESANLFTRILASKIRPGETRAPRGDDQRIAHAHVEYNRLNRPCGFLNQEDGTCRIYPVRPIACRFFFSLDDPETCSPLHDKYLRREIRTVPLPEEAHSLLAEIQDRLGLRLVNFLSGAFCQFAADVMNARPLKLT
jgi:Fe-S-cluster containining protein